MERTVTREMGISHEDFYRLLPGALGGIDFDRVPDGIEARRGNGRIRIQLGPEDSRRIASLALPVTRVQIHLSGFDATEMDALLSRFDLAYQRGGG